MTPQFLLKTFVEHIEKLQSFSIFKNIVLRFCQHLPAFYAFVACLMQFGYKAQ